MRRKQLSARSRYSAIVDILQRRALEQTSQEAFTFYRERIAEDSEVLEYFEQATPILELDAARIGSRPERGPAFAERQIGGVKYESLTGGTVGERSGAEEQRIR